MNQAAPAVCFADSDDEDYVSFDEEELHKGIGDLYDEDSASDYNDDDDADDNVNLNEIEIREEQDEEEDDDDDDDDDAEMEQSQQKEKKEEKKAKKWSLFSRKKEKESESMQRSAFSMAPSNNNNNNNKRKKKSKSSQLNKRMHRLQQNQQQISQKQRKKKIVHRQKVNTNVISVDLGTLKTAATNISTGDAFECKSCKSILSKHDKLLKTYDEIKLDDEDDSIWICAFCNHINIISIDNEEIPTHETVDYMLAPPANVNDNESKQSGDINESQIIFCIDISGSMCVSQQIDGKHSKFKLKGNRLDKDVDDLSQFIEANAGHLNKQKSDTQYVSRLQCVQTAVNEQIENISKTNPNYKIGLVTFNSDVTVIGDGMGVNEIITGNKLNNINKLKEIGSKCVVNNNIGTARDKLCDALWKLNETGQTALGPALVVSIAMASSKPGSQVILCTDGLANIGVGSDDYMNSVQENEKNKNKNNDMIEMDDEDDEEEEDKVLKWYEALGDYAMLAGVVVNIISITDDGCKLENLGKIVEITNGNLKRINPLNLAEKFSGIIENESIATNCQAKMLLHPGLKFHNTVDAAQVNLDEETENKNKKSKMEVEEKDENKQDDNNNDNNTELNKINEGRKIYEISPNIQECGNIFEGSRIFFEYVINKEKRKEFQSLKQLPFQVQITYQKKDGSKMLRVISQSKEITLDKKKVRNNLDFNVLAKYGTHVTTELCAKGDYESSRAWTSANTTFLNKNAANKRQLLTLANYAQENVALDHQMQRQIQTESIQEQQLMMDFDDNNMNNAMSFNNNNNNNKSYKSMSKSKKKKKKMKKRKNARNDQFSSHMYNLKKKSHK